MIKLGTSDLNYLLQQANILNDYTQLTSPIDPNGVREVSGSNNNLVGGFTVDANGNLVWTGGYDPTTGLVDGNNTHPDWGQADTDFLRLFQTDHPDTANIPSYGVTYTYQGVNLAPIADAQGNDYLNPAWDPTDPANYDANGYAIPDADGDNWWNPDWTPTFSSTMMDAQTIMTGEGTPYGTSPRTITQLIANSDVDPASPTYNPAAAAAMANFGGQPVDVANSVEGSTQTAFIPNPGILGGVPYNEFFVAFGQFFDHGLDFISKNGGYVLINLSPNDPLAGNGPMMLSRASLSNPAEDFMLDNMGNVVLKDGVAPQFNNNTGLMIDQSQTYGSHEAHNVLVREYDDNGNLTGRLIDGGEDGILTRVDPNTGDLVRIDLNTGTANVLDPVTLAVGAAYEPNGAGSSLDFTTNPGSVEWPFGSGNYTDGSNELATWADMKVNAEHIGIGLIDTDVLNIPSIKADAVGRLITPDVAAELGGLDADAQFVPQSDYLFHSDMSTTDIDAEIAAMPGGVVNINGVDYHNYAEIAQFDPFHRDANGNVLFSNQPVLADIAHAANLAMDPTGYNADLLAMHKVSGDGRVNENIGLTSVHHVFHEEHNIQAAQIKTASVMDAFERGDLTGLNGDGATEGWLAVDTDASLFTTIQSTINLLITGGGLTEAEAKAQYFASADFQTLVDSLTWDGEKIYQAARIITESEYNHVAIDQYVTTLYPALPEFVSYSSDINLDVSLEFSQAVFRLGHSQLMEQMQIATANETGQPGDPGYIATSFTQEDLFNAFLNPTLYDEHSAAGIVAGLQHQQGNEIDEFVTSALQQSLVGLPIDLAAINIARGRDVGLPTLNELRQQAFDGLQQNTSNNSNGSGIAPYTSWADFGGSMRNPDSLVNFIAAYAVDDGSTGHDWGIDEARADYEAGNITLQELRQTAQDLLNAYNDPAAGLHDEAVQFMMGGGAPIYDPTAPGNVNGWVYSGGAGDLGFWDIDLWIGGLAEQPLFDGPLGTTFSLVMLDFGQRMQDGDRYYYLYRMPVGHHLGDQIIGEQFSDLLMRTTGLENVGDAFGYQNAYYYLDGTNHEDLRDGDSTDGDPLTDPNGLNDYFNAIYESLPAVTKNIVVANKSFEVDSTTSGDPGVVTEPTYGNYAPGAPTGWTLTGNGGVFDPTTNAISDTGHNGNQVAYLIPGAVISQEPGVVLAEGNTYELTVNLGNRGNQAGTFSAEVRLVDSLGNILAAQIVTAADVANNEWSHITLTTSETVAALAGNDLRIEIQNNGTEQVLVDNVNLSMTEPGGSANDGHIVVAGYEGNDFIKTGLGDDYAYGGPGDDVIEGAQGNDHLYGGDGNDWITDYENDDFIHGGAGNDYISAGPGVLDTAHGGEGDDEVHGGDGIDEVFGDDGNDILFGEGDTDLMEGGDGNDYIDGGDSVDEIFAGNGNDWLRGGVGDDHMNGGSGNDLMEGGGGPVANDGDRYFGDQAAAALPLIEFNGDGTIGNMDIASYENLLTGVTASLQNLNATNTNSNLLDSYAFIDGIVGSAVGDNLEGGALDATGSNGWNNQLIGGGGSDRLIGLGDDAGVVTNGTVDADPNHYVDWIFGDAVVVRNDLWVDLDATMYYNMYGAVDGTTDGGVALDFKEQWGGKDIGIAASTSTTGETRVVFGDTGELGHILGEDGVDAANDVDTAVYHSDVTDYLITGDDMGIVTIQDTRAVPADPQAFVHDGIDKLLGIEKLEFNGVTYDLIVGSDANDRGAQGLGTLRGDEGNAIGVNTNDVILGLGGNDTLVGYGLSDYLVGGAGNDVVNGGGGNDIIIWNVGDGTDIVNGGGGNSDTFIVNGNADNEQFVVYSALEAVNNGYTLQNANTEIVITRNAVKIAELRNIEEITINTGAGTDNVLVVGNFDNTSLNYNTITVEGGDGDDTVDVSNRMSEHRLVFHGNGGKDTVIGTLKPQDVFDMDSDDSVVDANGQSDQNGDPGSDNPQDQANDTVSGDGGNHEIYGSAGDDTITGSDGDDNLYGSRGDDHLDGGKGDDDLYGGRGDDHLDGGKGDDNLYGGRGDDHLDGGEGDDDLYGGRGDDHFVFASAKAADGDHIGDFVQGEDTIDLSAIDANITEDGDQAFELKPGDQITGAGQVTYHFENGNTIVEGHVDGDGHADFHIEIAGQHNLTNDDFNL